MTIFIITMTIMTIIIKSISNSGQTIGVLPMGVCYNRPQVMAITKWGNEIIHDILGKQTRQLNKKRQEPKQDDDRYCIY